MFKKIFILVFFFTNQAIAAEVWNSSEGLKRLEKSQFKNDFYQLVNFYQPQISPVYCSVASSVIILNALNYGKISSQPSNEIKKPDGGVIEYKLFSQAGFLNDKTDKIKSRKIIEYKAKNSNAEYDAGVSIGDLSQILSKAYDLKTKLVYAETIDEKFAQDFRKNIKKIFTDKNRFVIANFDGKILGQKTNGHISPLVAYDENTDSVLVLDVALHKNLWFWTSLDDLLKAMNTKDADTYRGYLVVELR